MFLTNQVMEILQTLKTDGMGQDDHDSIVRFYEKLSGVEVRKQS